MWGISGRNVLFDRPVIGAATQHRDRAAQSTRASPTWV